MTHFAYKFSENKIDEAASRSEEQTNYKAATVDKSSWDAYLKT